MLILRRKVGEKIVIGEGIVVVVTRVSGARVTLGIEAPPAVHIVRGELRDFDEESPDPAAGESTLSAAGSIPSSTGQLTDASKVKRAAAPGHKPQGEGRLEKEPATSKPMGVSRRGLRAHRGHSPLTAPINVPPPAATAGSPPNLPR